MGTDASPDGMARLLFGTTRREVLALMLGRPDERFHFRAILRTLGGGSGAVQRELKQLVEAGLIQRQAEGHQVYYSANRDSAIFPELQSILEKTAGAVDVLRRSLASLVARGNIQAAFIYGSVAVGAQKSGSDVDLFILGTATLADVVPGLRQAEARLGREVNPTIYPLKEFRARVKEGSHFLSRVLAGPKLFIAGDEDELAAVAGKPVAGRSRAKR
jgi:predicted nucleotidyltransferase